MSAGVHGGRRAALPSPDWVPPERMLPSNDVEGPTAVRFIEQAGTKAAVFDFANLKTKTGVAVRVEPGVQRWFARMFLRRTGPRSGVTRMHGARGVHSAIMRLAVVLAEQDPPVRGPEQVRPVHIRAMWMRYAGMRCHRGHMEGLRALLRDDPELAPRTKAELFAQRLPQYSSDTAVTAYTGHEYQQIMIRLRRDVRIARDRIRAGTALLAQYRAGDIPEGTSAHKVAGLLDLFDLTGDLRRDHTGHFFSSDTRVGGLAGIGFRLCLSVTEMAAFALLLAFLTGENFGTVASWPAVSYRPDGGASPGGVALLEATKPRRGPDREHMITPLEDRPESLETLITGDDGERRLFRSPLRVYELLLELTAVSRRHGVHDLAHSALAPSNKFGDRWVSGVRSSHVGIWSRSHGFPLAGAELPDGLPSIDVRRLRQSVLERVQRPLAQTRNTMNDRYLKRSAMVQRDSQVVVGQALRAEVDKARTRGRIAVLPATIIEQARTDLAAAAAQAEVAPETLTRLISGQQDTAVAACVDHLAGPHTAPGRPCTASFLVCLSCENARALPHHLPVQIALRDRLIALRPHLDPQLWQVRYAGPVEQLEDILGHHTQAEQNHSRVGITDSQLQMVDDLVHGKFDLR